MQNGNYRGTPRVKTIQDYPQLKLTAPREGAMERNPSLMMYVHENTNNPSNSNVRIVVWTQSPDSDPNKKKIEAKMGLIDAMSIIESIKAAASSTEDTFGPVVAQTYVPKDFKNRNAGKREDVKVVVGKNENGVYISLVHWNSEMPRKRFFFGFDDMFEFVVNTEKNQTFPMFSSFKALAYADTLGSYMKEEMKKVWRPYVPNNNGNNGGGAYNGNRQPSGNYAAPDDDLPF